jgi:hypothetical protein
MTMPLTTDMLTSTNYSDTLSNSGLKYYMVRPVKLQQTPSGNYYNLGVGILDTVTISMPVSLNEIIQPSVNVSVFPNPAQYYLNVSILSSNSGMAKMYIVNVTGQRLSMISKQLQPGNNNYSLNTTNMISGHYTLIIEIGNRSEEIKWVKL